MRRNLVVRAVCAVVIASGAASAAEQQSLDEGWPARWNKVGPVETGVVAGLSTSIIFLEFLLKSPSTPRWDKPILFDADARSALRAGSPGGRSRAATASDFGYAGLPIYAIAVEAGLVAWRGQGKGDIALPQGVVQWGAPGLHGGVAPGDGK